MNTLAIASVSSAPSSTRPSPTSCSSASCWSPAGCTSAPCSWAAQASLRGFFAIAPGAVRGLRPGGDDALARRGAEDRHPRAARSPCRIDDWEVVAGKFLAALAHGGVGLL